MTILLLLLACDDTDKLSEDSRPMQMEAVSAERSGRIVLTKFWLDQDGDHYGTPGTSLWATDRPRGYVPRGGDCDGADAAINPGATEVSDGVDNDCDGTTDEIEADTGDSGSDSGTDSAADTADTSDSGIDTAVVVSTGILVSRDTSDGLSYPAELYAWYGSGPSTSMLSVNSPSETLSLSPSDADLSSHSWIDIQASWSSGASWSDDCTGFTVTSADYTVALYEKTTGGGTGDTCRIYVGLAVPSGGDVGVWTLVP